MSEQQMNTDVPEFAFLVVKQTDGRLAIASVNTEMARQPSMEDIFGALNALSKDLDRQILVNSILGALQSVATNQQKASGLVVPEKRFVKRAK